MYLFTRTGRLGSGNMTQSMTWAHSITEKVNQVTDLNVSLWTTLFSPALGTLTWTAIVEDMSALENADAKLMVDNGYLLLAEEGAHFLNSAGLDDSLAQFMTPMAAPEPGAPGPQCATVVRATIAPGGFVRGVELGVKIAARASEVTGAPTAFLSGVTGVYGQIAWVSTYDTVDQMQHALQAIGTDPTLIGLIDSEASQCYQPAAEQICLRRLV